MDHASQNLSVMEISEMCGVARSTVSYWVARKSLPAHRSGKKYLVSVQDLVLFLRSEGHPVPQILLECIGGPQSQPFRPLKRCWEYWASDPRGRKCQQCAVLRHRVDECFTARSNSNHPCVGHCHECEYYGEHYAPRVAFIHQLDRPAAVYRNLCIWSGNQAMADLFGVDVGGLIGAGIEEFVHPDSMRMVINYSKRRHQGDTSVPDRYQVFCTDRNGGKTRVELSISPLKRPSGTWLAIAERTDRDRKK